MNDGDKLIKEFMSDQNIFKRVFEDENGEEYTVCSDHNGEEWIEESA